MTTISKIDVLGLGFDQNGTTVQKRPLGTTIETNLSSVQPNSSADIVTLSQRAIELSNASKDASTNDAGGSQLPPLKPTNLNISENPMAPNDAGGSQLPPLKPRDKS